MKLTTNTNVSVDGVMQGLGGPEEDRWGGFGRGGWAMPHFDSETAAEDEIGEILIISLAYLRKDLDHLPLDLNDPDVLLGPRFRPKEAKEGYSELLRDLF